jgi:thiamine-phosphate pyrophosphorylase
MRRWVTPALMLITDRSLLGARSIEEVCSRAVDGGVTAVQLREKDLSGCDLYEMAMTLRAVLQGRALVLINDRADVAAASGSDGVHLPERCLPVHAVRRLVGDGCIVGRSVHSVEAAVQAEREGADYVQVGAVYATESHPDATPGGVDLVRAVADAVTTPAIAVGGIDASRVRDVIDAGADGIAVIRAILTAEDPALAAMSLSTALREAYAA